MPTMKAVTFTRGGPEDLSITQVDRPEPGAGEVLVRITAAGVNPIDWKTRAGDGVYDNFDPSSAMILGWDIAGIVESTGPGVTRFRVGDRVFGMPRFPQPAGGYAEFVTSPARQLALIPNGVSDLAAAATPLSGLTAYQAVVDTLDVRSGTRILIHGAGGHVGQFAVQIAKARRAEIWATEVTERVSTVQAFGIEHVIDATRDDFAAEATDLDVVLDLVGADDSPTRSLGCLKRGGQLLVLPSAGALPSRSAAEDAGVEARWMLVEPDHAGLEALAAMLGFGLLRAPIAATRDLEDVGELHQMGEAGDTAGQLVITVSL